MSESSQNRNLHMDAKYVKINKNRNRSDLIYVR